jgi:uncharacterized protein YceH (UPF0502 family)
MEILNAVDVRVLGCLIEKDITTPDYYPLTLNALTNACNQTSNRDPVVAFGEKDVVRGLDSLREKKLAFQFQGADSRVPKYGHRAAEALELARPETAVLCVLLLRGPQTPGEIRTRTQRMHDFASIEETEASIDLLISRGFAARLPRQSGMKEQRAVHLFSGEVQLPPPAAAAAMAEPAAIEVRFENERLSKLEGEAAALRAEVAELRQHIAELRKILE